MEPTAHTPDPTLLERLTKDYKRMSLVYGLSIISLALVITAMVWSLPSFELFPKTYADAPENVNMDHARATTTPEVSPVELQ